MTADFPSAARAKPPRPIFDTIFAFLLPIATPWGERLILSKTPSDDGSPGNILVDSPVWDEATQTFLAQQGGVRWLFITHRANLGKAAAIHQSTGCKVVIQEQGAYLLPSTPKNPVSAKF